MKRKTWKVLAWDYEPDSSIPLTCPKCGIEAEMPTHGPSPMIIAVMGLSLVMDPPGATPPKEFMPAEIQCRYCRSIFVDREETIDVR